ncbi:hypothetical protein M427DRAFT_152421 [Gonapodya prolifera JEL478]|uniref:Cyclin N-terminal domain-containing protein n=1 Tax=Gonapodya prolifera (strain JEL478) TaxID=1344416 RepID=A0A139ARL9_GONPJ|nr:hypothetical protein M427DRAFT_152421 [Gonapodya prolifera JEL478]|eukprot:KXS19400.1 hypothetical protein M427DRAFT_152421 [Gonapodya prolifera JEL478]
MREREMAEKRRCEIGDEESEERGVGRNDENSHHQGNGCSLSGSLSPPSYLFPARSHPYLKPLLPHHCPQSPPIASNRLQLFPMRCIRKRVKPRSLKPRRASFPSRSIHLARLSHEEKAHAAIADFLRATVACEACCDVIDDSSSQHPRCTCLDLRKYISSLCTISKLSLPTLHAAHMYLQRLRLGLGGSSESEGGSDEAQNCRVSGTPTATCRLFISSVTLANKYLSDVPLCNRWWATVTGYSEREINQMEFEFLDIIEYDLSLPTPLSLSSVATPPSTFSLHTDHQQTEGTPTGTPPFAFSSAPKLPTPNSTPTPASPSCPLWDSRFPAAHVPAPHAPRYPYPSPPDSANPCHAECRPTCPLEWNFSSGAVQKIVG